MNKNLILKICGGLLAVVALGFLTYTYYPVTDVAGSQNSSFRKLASAISTISKPKKFVQIEKKDRSIDSYSDKEIKFGNALIAGNLRVVKTLLRKGVSLDLRSPKGDPILITAIRNGHLDIVKYLVKRKGVDPDSADREGETALMLATSFGHVETVKYLVDQGADVNAKNNLGSSVLSHVISMSHPGGDYAYIPGLVKYLKSKGAKRDDRVIWGNPTF